MIGQKVFRRFKKLDLQHALGPWPGIKTARQIKRSTVSRQTEENLNLARQELAGLENETYYKLFNINSEKQFIGLLIGASMKLTIWVIIFGIIAQKKAGSTELAMLIHS